ncbi:hypothetical protein [Frankia sp. AvcI1]|uniref:hypothetical protein n=1 Tax=Frankia sp. AvcI1 TaxID=573496 RepID=UPI0021186A8F|nr:hypothetical protein [Frankia sp. AvcI1]
MTDEDLDRWLTDQHADLITDLTDLLDLGAGLQEVVLADHHSGLVDDVRNVLDLDAGFAAITSAREDHTPDKDAAPPRLAGRSVSATVRLLESFDVQTRLNVRGHPAVIVFARALDLALALALVRELVRALDLTRARARELARELVRALDRARIRDLERDPDRELDRDLDRALSLARALARILDRDRARARARALNLDLTLGFTLDRALDRALDRVRDLDHELDRALNDAVRTDLGHLAGERFGDERDVVAALDRIRQDFTDADLREVDLSHVDLTGVRWSQTTTQWPAAWEEQIRHASVSIGDDLWEVRGGTTNVPTSTYSGG